MHRQEEGAWGEESVTICPARSQGLGHGHLGGDGGQQEVTVGSRRWGQARAGSPRPDLVPACVSWCVH